MNGAPITQPEDGTPAVWCCPACGASAPNELLRPIPADQDVLVQCLGPCRTMWRVGIDYWQGDECVLRADPALDWAPERLRTDPRTLTELAMAAVFEDGGVHPAVVDLMRDEMIVDAIARNATTHRHGLRLIQGGQSS